MKITTVGRGEIDGTLERLWAAAGHDVSQLGRDGGDAGDAEVVLLAPPGAVVAEALAGVSGLDGKVIVDATNRLASRLLRPTHKTRSPNTSKRPPMAALPRCSISTTVPSWTTRPAPR
jgi:predicted dinucleotide-binding enzyme